MKYAILGFGLFWFIVSWIAKGTIDEMRMADVITPQQLWEVTNFLHAKIAAYACWAAYAVMDYRDRQVKKAQ